MSARVVMRMIGEITGLQDAVRTVQRHLEAISGQGTRTEASVTALAARCATIEATLVRMVTANERLLRERQTLLEAIAFQKLREVGAPVRPEPPTLQPPEWYDPADLERFFHEANPN